MNLNYLKSGSGNPLIILHGLFGMLDNWKTVAKELEKNFTVFIIDQRNHGKSPHTAEHSYQLMADDLYSFFHQHGIQSAIILGHSMGGKTAMRFALDHADMVEKLIVVDMGVKRYPAGHDTIFDALFALDLKTINSRSEAEAVLKDKLRNQGERQFILKNLTRNHDGTYSWKFNLEAIHNNYEDEILAAIESDHPFQGTALFIRGEFSSYIKNEDWDGIQALFPAARLETIEGAGHWVHADKPVQLLQTIRLFLQT